VVGLGLGAKTIFWAKNRSQTHKKIDRWRNGGDVKEIYHAKSSYPPPRAVSASFLKTITGVTHS
jgi:hypothetical protein